MAASGMDGGYRLRISSLGTGSTTVLFEPGLGKFSVVANDYLEIEVRGSEGEAVEVEYGDGWVTIWSSPKTRLSVYDSVGKMLPLLDA